jgi:hypothetical protein
MNFTVANILTLNDSANKSECSFHQETFVTIDFPRQKMIYFIFVSCGKKIWFGEKYS